MKALGACMECRRRWIGCTMEHWDLSLFETQYSCRHMPIPSYPVITAEEAEVSEGNSNDRVNNSSLQGTESSNRSNEPTTPQSLTQSEASMESLMGEEICLEQKKGDILRRVTLHVSNLIRTIFIQVRGAQHSVTASETQAQLSSQKDSTSSRSNESYRSTKRRRLSEKDNFGSDDEDDGRRQPESIQTPNDEESDPKMFACPYFKYNPGRYKTERNCPGPGWPSVHRVKEHLYRRHRQPRFRCGRCWQPFKDEASFLDHQRTPQPCELGEQEYVEGFDAAQEKRLKARKRANPDLSEAERWCEVFKILFPHVDHDKIPSPFYEYGELSSSSESPDRLAECEEYLLREVPARLHQALSRELDRDLEAVEEGLKKKAIACVKDLIPELFRELRRPKRSDRRAAPAEPLQPPPSQTDNIQNEDDGPDLEQIILGGLGSVITTLEYSGFGFGEGSLAESLSEPSSWDDPLSGLDLSEADCSLQLTPGTAGLLPDMDGWHLVDFDEITSDRHLNQYLPGHNSLDGPLENHLSTEFNGGDLEGAVTLPELPSDFAESYLEEQSFEIASYESETGHCSSDRVDS
ncbi:hypothetical protein QBC43DRAFT_95670 [Cladorrhinum sp. PSN259]|nr:hypothetical protein QBC43DRAFT_95670 [Cladorrhinum sp. PSN259]